MKYKLYTDIKYDTVTEQVLKGRGIYIVEEWINVDDSSIEK